MKRRLALLLALLLTAGLCSGFHGKSSLKPFTVPETLELDRNYEISFWAKNDTNISQVNVYKKAIEDFEALYPNIKVKLKLYTDYGTIYNDVITNISTGTTPNVCITYPDHIATYMTGENIMAPLDGLFADGRVGFGGSELRYDGPLREEMVEKFLKECSIQGESYAIPFMRSTEACYINKTFVEALGYEVPDVLTWDFIWEVSAAAAEKNPDGTFRLNGQKTLLPFMYKSTDNMMIQWLRQKGAGYSRENGDILLYNSSTRQILNTVSEYAGMGAFSTFKFASYPANFLNAGQCIFAVDSTAGSTWMGCDAPLLDIAESQLVKFETVVRMIPQEDPEHPQMISQGPSVCLFNKEDPQEVVASWLFAQFLLTNDVQLAYAATEGYVPVTLKAQNSPEYQDYLSRSGEDNKTHYSIKIDASKLLMEHTEDTFITPVFNGSASLRDAAGSLIEEVVKARYRRQTVDDAAIDKYFAKTASEKHLERVITGEAAEVIEKPWETQAETGPEESQNSSQAAESRPEQETGAPESGESTEKVLNAADLGPLPRTAVGLLTALGVSWVLIGGFALYRLLKKKKH